MLSSVIPFVSPFSAKGVDIFYAKHLLLFNFLTMAAEGARNALLQKTMYNKENTGEFSHSWLYKCT
jgi:hypothetical protein